MIELERKYLQDSEAKSSSFEDYTEEYTKDDIESQSKSIKSLIEET